MRGARLHLYFCYYKQCEKDQPCLCFLGHICEVFLSGRCLKVERLSFGMLISSIIRCHHVAFQSDCAIYPPTICRVLTSMYPSHHLKWSALWKFDDPMRAKGYPVIALIAFPSSPPIADEIEHLIYVYWPFGFFLRWIVGSYPFPIFLSCSLCFVRMICERSYVV